MELITLDQAKAQGLKKYFTGEPCARGHVTFRRTDCRVCWECFKIAQRAWRDKNRPATAAIDARYRRAGGEAFLAKKRTASKLDYNARPEHYAERCKARRAGNGQRTPTWANRKAIRVFYREAIRLTKETGVVHEVDHVIPLRGRNVSGLHVEYNLQVIPQRANRQKSNKLAA